MAELKTLKDLKDEWKSSIIKESDLQSEAIEFSYTGELIPLEIIEGDLKQEAIKWIKYYQEQIKSLLTNLLNPKLKGDNIEGIMFCRGKIDFIAEFFNITEEDLQ